MGDTQNRADTNPAAALPASPSFRNLCACGGRASKPATPACCVSAHDTPIEQPDLAIYSQLERITNGALPSWDNPDIVSHNWPPLAMRPEATVTVRNLSTTTSAINGLVHYYTSPFGIGTPRRLRTSRLVNLGPGEQIQLPFPLYEEALDGESRPGIHIEIQHPHDPHPINNSGSQLIDAILTSASGRDFHFPLPVVNNAPEGRQIALSILPNGLEASLTPSRDAYAPFEQRLVDLHVVVPASLAGSSTAMVERDLTIVGRAVETGDVIGGLTLLVGIDT